MHHRPCAGGPRRTERRRGGRRSVRDDATPTAAGSVRRQAVHHSFTRASPSCAKTAEVPRPAILLLCFRERPVTRPTCMRLLLVPGVLQACTLCSVPGCLGNAWDGITAIIRHHKTASTYGTHTITVLEGSSCASARTRSTSLPNFRLGVRGRGTRTSVWRSTFRSCMQATRRHRFLGARA